MVDIYRSVSNIPGAGGVSFQGQQLGYSEYNQYQMPGTSQGTLALTRGKETAPYALAFPLFVAADFANTVSSSVGLTDDDALEQKLKQYMPDAAKFYTDHKGGIQLTSSVGGAFIPGTLAIKGINAATKVGAALNKLPYASRFLINEKKAAALEAQLAARAQFMGEQGVAGGALKLDTEYNKLARARLVYGIDKGIKETAASELAIVATMNSSDVLFPDEWQWYDYAPIMAVGGTIAPGIEAIIARKATSRALQQSAPTAYKALIGKGPAIDQAIVRVGEEDAAITVFQLNSRALDDQIAARGTDVTSTYNSQVQRAKLANEGAILGHSGKKGLIGKIASHNSALAPGTTITDSQKQNARLALEADPFAFLGVKEISAYEPQEVTRTALDKRKSDYVAELKAQADKKEARANSKKVSRAEKQFLLDETTQLRERARVAADDYQPWVLRNGEWHPMEDHFVLFTDFADNRKAFSTAVPFDLKGRKLENHYDPVAKQNFSFGIDYSFDYAGTKGKNLATLHFSSIYEQSAVFAGFDAVIDGIKNIRSDRTAKMPRIQITNSDDWRRLDAIDEGIRRGAIRETDLTFAPGLDIDKMRMSVINKKFQEFQRFRERAQSTSPYLKKAQTPLSDAAIRYALNLPAARNGEVSGLEQFFHGAINQGSKNLDAMSLQSVIEQVANIKHFADPDLSFVPRTIAEMKADDFNTILRGNSFGRMEKPNQARTYLDPILAWKQNLDSKNLSMHAIENSLQIRRQDVKNTLMQPWFDPKLERMIDPASTMSGQIAMKLDGFQPAQVAAGVDQINQASLRGNATLTTSRFASRDDPVMQAAHEINTIVDRIKNRHIIDTLNSKGSHGKQYVNTFATLRTKENQAHLFQLGEYLRARQAGWFLGAKAVQMPNGNYRFVLRDDSQFNLRRYRALFGEDLKTGTVMPRITSDNVYQPLELSQQAYEAALSMKELGEKMLADQNRIRKGMGQQLINKKEWWAPPRVFTDKHIAYVVNKTDEGSIKRIITGDTAADLHNKINSTSVQDYVNEVGGVIYEQADMVKRLGTAGFSSAREKVYFELLDAGDHLVKGTKSSRGSSVDPFVSDGRELLDEATESMNKQWENIARDTTYLWFESQIAYANRSNFVHPATSGQRSAWAYYKDTLVGNRLIRSDDTIGPIWSSIETGVDKILESYWDATKGKGITGMVAGTAQKALATVGFDPQGKRFTKLKSELGEWLPYENAQEFAASQFNIKPPKNAKQFAAALNKYTSMFTLRLFEIAHPLLNLSGIVATSPAVIGALARRVGESPQEWAGRTSLYGTTINAGKPFSFFNAVKTMTKAATFGFKPEGRAELLYAQKFGYFDQQVAELNEIIVKPLRSQGDYSDWANRAVDIMSTLSDKSEVISRGWAHMAGVLLAKQHGITDQSLRHVFAHRFANEMIGDYRSANRPVVFQGAAGMPLGLFQTYMWNYYQRMFGYIENSQTRALVTQFAMQGSVYGAQTMPGYSLFNSMWASANQGKDMPVDAIQARFGNEVADVLLYGTLSNIPKIFGGDGIALYTRGDTSPRVPAFIDPSQAPIYQFGKNFFGMLQGVADQLQSGGQGLSAQQTAETFSQFFINRPMARTMELYADYSTDRNGNVISADIHNMTSYISRVMGLRPLQEAKAIEVLQRQKNTELNQYAMRARLRESIKSAIRGDNVNGELLAGSIEDYAKSGGDPRYFGRFLKTLVLNATTPKAQVELTRLLNSDTRILDSMRLLNSGVMVDEMDAASE